MQSLAQAADCLAIKANVLSRDKDYLSPFQKEFRHVFERGGPIEVYPPADYAFMGGKPDDITVTVAQIFAAMPPGVPDPLR